MEYNKEKKSDKLFITVFTGSVDKLMGLANLVAGAVAMDMEVEVFVSLWGIYAFKKDVIKNNMHLSEFKDKGDMLMKRMMELKMPMWFDLLKQCKEEGNVKIYACAGSTALWDVKKEDLEMVDSIIGVGEYLLKAKEATISLVL